MSQTPETERSAISAAIVVEDGKVLMVRRQVEEGELSWQFPAGQVEPGSPPRKPQSGRPARKPR